MNAHMPGRLVVLSCLCALSLLLLGCSKNPPPPDNKPHGQSEPSIHKVIVPPKTTGESTGPRTATPTRRSPAPAPSKPQPANTGGWGAPEPEKTDSESAEKTPATEAKTDSETTPPANTDEAP